MKVTLIWDTYTERKRGREGLGHAVAQLGEALR